MSPVSVPARFAAIQLPLLGTIVGTIGLATRIGSAPDLGNVGFVFVALLASGVAPVAVLVGLGLLAADVCAPKLSVLWLVVTLIAAATMSWLCFGFGQGLDF